MAHVVDYFSTEKFATAKKERKTVTIPKKLTKQAATIIEDYDISSFSELITVALAEFVDKIEKMKLERELAEGYQANKEYYAKMSEEWKFADSE